MLRAFAKHWEHRGMREAWGPASQGLAGGALAKLAGLSANRGEIEASLRLMMDKGWIERCQTPNAWIEDIVPHLTKISSRPVQELTGNSSHPDTWWYILTQKGLEYAQWLQLPKWHKGLVIVRGLLVPHIKEIVIGVIIALIVAGIWAIVQH